MRRSAQRAATIGGLLAAVGDRRATLDELAAELAIEPEQLAPMLEQLVTARLLRRVAAAGGTAFELTEAGRQRAEPEPTTPAAPTPDLTETLCAELRLGRSLERACAVCEVPAPVVRRWLAAGEKAAAAGGADDLVVFAEAVARARVDATAAFAATLERTVAVDWKAAAALLRAHEAGYSGPPAEDDVATAPPRRALTPPRSTPAEH